MLSAGANILYKNRQLIQKEMMFLKKYLLGDDVSKDIELLLS